MISQYAHVPFTLSLNFMKIPITVFNTNDAGAEAFNAIVDECHEMSLNRIKRTPSGGVSISIDALASLPAYDIRANNSCVELTLISAKGCYRFQFRHDFNKDKGGEVSGHHAYYTFAKVCDSFGVNLEDYRIQDKERAREVKQSIPRAYIDLLPGFEDLTIPNVHHLDIHSAYMAGVADAFPDLRSPIDYCYKNRKFNPKFKAILTHCWGYFQSQFSPVYYGFSNLSKAGIDFTRREIERLTRELNESGRLAIMRNTDGIWYAGEIYHGENEGEGLGQWSNDYFYCKFRAKSRGAYEYDGFEDEAKARPAMAVIYRGHTSLDSVKPRDKWEWDDLYNCGGVLGYYYDPVTEHIYKEVQDEAFTNV